MMMTMMLFPDTLHAIHDSSAVVGRSFAFAFKGQTNQSCLKINDSIIVSSTFYKLQVENIKFITNFERCNASWAWAVHLHPENTLEESCHLSSICECVCVCDSLLFSLFLLAGHLSIQSSLQTELHPTWIFSFFLEYIYQLLLATACQMLCTLYLLYYSYYDTAIYSTASQQHTRTRKYILDFGLRALTVWWSVAIGQQANK